MIPAIEEAGLFSKTGHICNALGIRLADYLMALYKAHDAALADFGAEAIQASGGNAYLFEMHFVDKARDNPARIWFTVREDVRARLEKLSLMKDCKAK